MLKSLYMRPENRKPACRRWLTCDTGESVAAVASAEVLCQTHTFPWLAAECVRCSHCSEGGRISERSVPMCPLPTKETRDQLAISCGSSLKPSTTFSSFPELWAFLTCDLSPDGSRRPPGRVSLCCEQGLWKLVLTDVNTSLYACLTSMDLDSLILMAEARLSESTVPWRPSTFEPRGKKKS